MTHSGILRILAWLIGFGSVIAGLIIFYRAGGPFKAELWILGGAVILQGLAICAFFQVIAEMSNDMKAIRRAIEDGELEP